VPFEIARKSFAQTARKPTAWGEVSANDAVEGEMNAGADYAHRRNDFDLEMQRPGQRLAAAGPI
jgi:hypothetical protein